MYAKLWDKSNLFVCFSILHIAHGNGACQPDIFNKYSFGCELSDECLCVLCDPCYSRWALQHYNQCMGENRRKKHLAKSCIACERGGV